MTDSSVRGVLRSFILEKFLPGEKPSMLRDDTALISSGVLSSLSLIKLVAFLADEFQVQVGVEEMENLDTVADLERLIHASRGDGAPRGE